MNSFRLVASLLVLLLGATSVASTRSDPNHAVQGRVFDAAGHPVPGLTVYLLPSNIALEGLHSAALNLTLGTRFLGVAKTDAEGRFNMDWLIRLPPDAPPLPPDAGGVPPGTYQLCVTSSISPTRVSRQIFMRVEVGSAGIRGLELRFPSSGPVITGRVVDRSGVPVAGASVAVVPRRLGGASSLELRERAGPSYERTDEQGRYELENLDPGAQIVVVWKEGYEQVAPVEAEPGTQAPDIVLEPREMLRGRVFNVDGRPADDFWVTIDTVTLLFSGGRYALPISSTETLTLRIDVPGNVSKWLSVPVREGEDATAPDVHMSRGRTVSVKLEDARSGAPVTDATFTLDTPSGRTTQVRHGSSDKSPPGIHAIDGLSDDDVVLKVTSKGYAPLSIKVPRGSTEVVGRLERGVVLEGAITDGKGQPLEGALLMVRQRRRPEQLIRSDGRGHFMLAGLEPGAARLRVGFGGSNSLQPLQIFATEELELPPTGTVRVDIRFTPRAPSAPPP